MPYDYATEYRIIRHSLATLVQSCLALGDPSLQALALDAKQNLDYTSEAEPVGWTDAEMAAYDRYADECEAAVEF